MPACPKKRDVPRGLRPVLHAHEQSRQPAGEPQAQIVGQHAEPRRELGKLFLEWQSPIASPPPRA